MRFTFFHAADLHLGAASEGVMRGAPDAVREAVESSTYRAFENLIDDAENQRPAFVLFPGDLYNAADENLKARLAFRDGIVRLDNLGIQSFVIRGNHDYFRGPDPLRLPESCCVFEPAAKSAVEAVHQGRSVARIFGQSYPSHSVKKNLAAGYPLVSRNEDGLLQIAMLHGNLEGAKNLGSDEKNTRDYAPFTMADLQERGYDYWALGHVHGHGVLAAGPYWAAYTGTLQGISPRETGPKGYIAISVSNGSIERIAFRESDVLRWDELQVDLGGVELLDEVAERIEAAIRKSLIDAAGRPVVARLRLCGTTSLNEKLRAKDFPDFIEALRQSYGAEAPFLWIDDFSVETKPEIDWDSIRNSHSLPGYLLELSEGRNPEFESAIEQSLKDSMGKMRFDLPSQEELELALRRAGERAVSLLNLGEGE